MRSAGLNVLDHQQADRRCTGIHGLDKSDEERSSCSTSVAEHFDVSLLEIGDASSRSSRPVVTTSSVATTGIRSSFDCLVSPVQAAHAST